MTVVVMRAPFVGEKIVGMKFFYDCPRSGEDFDSDRFFAKYRGKIGTIVGVTKKGEETGVDIQFDGEKKVYKKMNIRHLILLPTPKEEELAVNELANNRQLLIEG